MEEEEGKKRGQCARSACCHAGHTHTHTHKKKARVEFDINHAISRTQGEREEERVGA